MGIGEAGGCRCLTEEDDQDLVGAIIKEELEEREEGLQSEGLVAEQTVHEATGGNEEGVRPVLVRVQEKPRFEVAEARSQHVGDGVSLRGEEVDGWAVGAVEVSGKGVSGPRNDELVL